MTFLLLNHHGKTKYYTNDQVHSLSSILKWTDEQHSSHFWPKLVRNRARTNLDSSGLFLEFRHLPKWFRFNNFSDFIISSQYCSIQLNCFWFSGFFSCSLNIFWYIRYLKYDISWYVTNYICIGSYIWAIYSYRHWNGILSGHTEWTDRATDLKPNKNVNSWYTCVIYTYACER